MTGSPDTEPCGTMFVGRRGFRQRAGAATRRLHEDVYCVQGESLSIRQLAARLGIGEEATRQRLKRAQAQAGQVTWEKLGRQAA